MNEEQWQFAPAPWREQYDTQIVDYDGNIVALVFDHNDPQLMQANKRLIVAAPELLEALQSLMQQTNNIEVLGEWAAEDRNHATSKKLTAEVEAVKSQARTAIAKAMAVQS